MQTGRLRKLCKCHVCRQGKGGVGYEHYFISDIRCSCEQCNPEPVHGYLSILGVSKKVSTAAGMGGAVIFVMTIASAVTSVIYHFVLVPLKLSYLNTIVFILVIAALVQFVEMFLKKTIPSLYEALGVYLPLITTNCAVLGIALKNVQDDLNIGESIINGMFSAVGFAIAIIVMAGIREKIDKNDIPESFKGAPIVLITAGLMAIAFLGLNGLI